MRKNCKGEEQNELPWNPLGGCFSLSSPYESSPTQLRCASQGTPGATGTADIWETRAAPLAAAQAKEHQEPQAQQTYGKRVRHPSQQHSPQQEIQKTGLVIQAPSSSNVTLKVATAVQQIMTELSEAVSEKDKTMVITKVVLNLKNKMATRIQRPLKIIAFNANGIWRQHYELSKRYKTYI
jgi:hypothetical protein